jgi:hypothetical protein
LKLSRVATKGQQLGGMYGESYGDRAYHRTVLLHFEIHNRQRATLRVTSAMEAGLTSHPWNLEELIGFLDSI